MKLGKIEKNRKSEMLISIVVPVYNVEKYLDYCIDSLVKQTYKNLDIILVDDGSTDASGLKCDEWAEKDDRIRVFHKDNGGLSDARNYGIKHSKGEYIGFVDSDDFVEKEMYEQLMDALQETSSDISMCYAIDENEIGISPTYKSEEFTVLNAEEALFDLFTDNIYVRHAAWNKLYRRRVWTDILFPKNRLFEDAAIMYQVIDKAKNIVCIKSEMYHYVQRNGSISKSKYVSKSIGDRVKNFTETIDYFENNFEIKRKVYQWYFERLVSLYEIAFYEGDGLMCKGIAKALRKKYISRGLSCSLKRKVKAYLFLLDSSAYIWLKKKKRNISSSYTLINLGMTFESTYCALLRYRKHIRELKDISKDIIVLWGAPEHGNLGDQAILYSEITVLEDAYPQKHLLVVPEKKCKEYLYSLIQISKHRKIQVFLHGGGNVGTLYKEQEYIRHIALKHLRNSRIVMFPQSVDYEKHDKFFWAAYKIYNKHPNLTLFARDKMSYEKMLELKKNDVFLCPDIVMSLNIKAGHELPTKDFFCCFRNDKERSNESIIRIKKLIDYLGRDNCTFRDTYGEQYSSSYNQQTNQLYQFWKDMREYRLVITDRLHGMIFSLINGIPCIALDNSTGKVKSYYETWLKNDSRVLLYEDNFTEVLNFIKDNLLTDSTKNDNESWNEYEILYKALVE